MMPFHHATKYLRWNIDQMWVMVPMQTVIKNFFATLPNYPFQVSSSLGGGYRGYGMLEKQEALKKLQELQRINIRQ